MQPCSLACTMPSRQHTASTDGRRYCGYVLISRAHSCPVQQGQGCTSFELQSVAGSHSNNTSGCCIADWGQCDACPAAISAVGVRHLAAVQPIHCALLCHRKIGACSLRQLAVQGQDPAHDQLGNFLCGLAAGAVAKLGTHPLDVAKKRFQVEPAAWRAGQAD